MATTRSDVMAHLQGAGVDMLVGTVVTASGLTHAKVVDIAGVPGFADAGLGVSPVWHVFTVDRTGIAYTDRFGPVGDQRIRIDLDAVRILDDHLAWAPADVVDQSFTPVDACARTTLRDVETRLAAAGLTALVGHELEFTLLDADAAPVPSTMWAQYGVAGVLEHEGFVHDVVVGARRAGIGLAQLHPEYGGNQFEVSLAPLSPVAAADQLVATRLVVGRAARRHGLRACFSPKPVHDGVGNGAHQHFSLTGPDGPLFSGGDGVRGLTAAGASAIGGVLAGLPQVQAVLCGSILSGLRVQPGFWAGAYACWGTENREASVRLVEAGPANPAGAHVEVKIVDPSANPYLASAAILGLALDGVERGAPLPPETTVDPAGLSDTDRDAAGTVLLPTDQTAVLDALEASATARSVLGDEVVEATLAVRRYEAATYGDRSPSELTAMFRMSWSV